MHSATRIVVGGTVTIALLMAASVDPVMAAKWTTFTIPGCLNDCTFEYYHSNGKSKKKNWKQAKSICRNKYSSELVSITSAEEQAFLATLGSDTTWIGLQRDRNTLDFEAFVDGTAVLFTSWAAGEPNNFKQREDCAMLHKKSRQWNDATCQKKARYICKRRPIYLYTTTTTKEPVVSTDAAAQTTTTGEPDTSTVPTAGYCAFKNPQGCCRAADGSEGVYSEVEADELFSLGGTGRGCRGLCSEDASCTGYEVHKATGRCELHTGDISFVEQNMQLKCRCFKKDITGQGYTNANCNKPTTTTTTPCVFPGCTTTLTSTTTSVTTVTTATLTTTTTATSTTLTTTTTSQTSTSVTQTSTTVSSTTVSSTTTSQTSTSVTQTSTTVSSTTTSQTSTSTTISSTTTSVTTTTRLCLTNPSCSLSQCKGDGAEVTRQICPDTEFTVPGVAVTITYPSGTCSCLQGFRLSGPGCEAQGDCCPSTFSGECKL